MEGLTDLVLIDILSALPMRQVLRVMRLGSPRLRQKCGLPWVTRRMANVSFDVVVEACVAEEDACEALCSHPVMKRLFGAVLLKVDDLEDETYKKVCIKQADRTPGNLHLYLKYIQGRDKYEIATKNVKHFMFTLEKPENILCITYAKWTLFSDSLTWPLFPNLLCEQQLVPKEHGCRQGIKYRPALLNGRHIVDVVRAISTAAEADEARLEDIRTLATFKVTEGCFSTYEGVYHTRLEDAVIVAPSFSRQ